jgi:hypothetical protein
VKPARIALWLLPALLLAAALLTAALWFAARAVLAPLPGEWSAPLHAGPLQLRVGVPSLIRLATAPWVGPLLDGRTLATPHGPVRMAWMSRSATLALLCAPCTVPAAGLGDQPLHLDEVRLSVRRQGEQLAGELSSGKLHGRWSGELTAQRLRLRLDLPMTPIADGYALFHAGIPELATARIEGRFAATVQVTLPAGTWTIAPRIEGFEVHGLGTEALTAASSACSARPQRLTTGSWLARAVVAAEDQRFFEHSGYDLAELAAALGRNQHQGRVDRGASTLSQQLAKLLVTGGERTATRKLRELLYAVEMERTLGKARILTLYLSHAPWGEGLCGAEAASRHYFGRSAHQLRPSQAAWLAAMLHNPAHEAQRWSETGQINVSRTQLVLAGMRDLPRRQRALLVESAAGLAWDAPPAAGKRTSSR